MEKFLREWRQDALNKHQYESAIFIGDKLLALTNNDKDAFWLAQVHFSTGNYSRALSFLAKNDLIKSNSSCRYLAAHCLIKQSKFEEALVVLGDKNPVHLISAPGSARRKRQHIDALVHGKLRNGKGAVRSDRIDRSDERDHEDSSNIKFEAAMCYLRGVCYAKQNAFDRAKECYKDAVQIDVQCFEAFDQLMKNSLMSPEEEWKFLESLDFDSITVNDSSSSAQEAAEFTKMLYMTRLSKYEHPENFTLATETLSTHYKLSDNPDILLAKADLLFTQCRFRDSLTLTEAILSNDRYNFAALPVHLACLHELNEKNALFLISHDLADNHPEEPASWLAIGVYYLTIRRVAEARRFFSKSSMMDPHFGPAWIGFAHTFAAEGEHDQAISAYSTAARLFQGTHLPPLFLGMQNLQLNNLALAHEYLNSAYGLCRTDPLLLNELGVVFYHEDHLEDAIKVFVQALRVASDIHSEPRAWIATRANLGHALRRAGRLPEALEQFDEVLRQGGKEEGAPIFTAKGLVLMEMERAWDAVVVLHEALAVSPQDPIAGDLLKRALELNGEEGIMEESEEEEFDRKMEGNRRGARVGRKGRAKMKEVVVEDMDGSLMMDADLSDE
ncbi:tetratricopeptide [Eremomyces bilateralis CBS 781.70]|uniref:Tetratricopeptide n=1 Tax=Eremomyces bilateralis CBS 781.70 TaxID=1392243 RepID=A0A6G1G699_9PEZI|nr:tetratricopeptide [Eremomyces bilateralis CBS 781.70]KAF1813597.1 tetratricopeptide [Eremomyces bilateralis CBS 781.70]